MKSLYLCGLACFLVVGCKDNSSNLATSDRQAIEYQIDDNQYAVVIVRTEGMTEEQAKGLAMKKAAEKTQSEKFRYFTIESEDQVQAMSATDTPYDNPSPPSNMYYNLIQSGDFGRERFDDQQNPQENTYPGYRIVFKCYQERPSGKAVDVCDVLSCGK